jgi:hypothetical protein
VPLIEASPGELNQVWTNVIDAMEGSGTAVRRGQGYLRPKHYAAEP